MNNRTREIPPLTYMKEKYEEKTTSIKLIYRGRNKKVSLPLYHVGSSEELLCLIQDVKNWMIDYEFNQDLHINQVYESFLDCMNDHARHT